MTTAKATLPYLERRPGGFLYRRRIPGRASPVRPVDGPGPDPRADSPKKKTLRLSLRTHVPAVARILAMRLTALFDLAFALVTERAMDHLRPDQIEMFEALAPECRGLMRCPKWMPSIGGDTGPNARGSPPGTPRR